MGSSANHCGHSLRLFIPIEEIWTSASMASVAGAIIPAATQAAEFIPRLSPES
jgi:hypothetical protein